MGTIHRVVPIMSGKPAFYAETKGPRGPALGVVIAAATWFDARAYAARVFAEVGTFVDTMSIACRAYTGPMRAQVELEWRGSDYGGVRRLWVRDRLGSSPRWRPWRLA